ncbi:MAG TPA: carbohydrate porin [Leptolyngbyaceae cyanobacterium M33_DOE_097]|uniref:SLH domain-containing protein n=1 Tax=Oscillatoriales cyanobacterium SpSt-418 TaxID=2282169 RepID=A0A7C3PGG1_9CYAN|nr:carbohydrate porin [Leptolyngbyaceae cyanobacterium M33_DOE_097]
MAIVKKLRGSLLGASLVAGLGALGAVGAGAIAAPLNDGVSPSIAAESISLGVDPSSDDEKAVEGQVTSVSQLSDVNPNDWAFQALQSLVERYGCIVGYPDRTYRGNQALTRYEFAAGLNACLDRISELIAANTADFIKKEDLDAVRKLQEEFAAELATLRGRVDALEARTTTLEKQQFSTTTKLSGEVIFAISDTFGDRATRNGSGGFLAGVNANNEDSLKDDQTNTIFADRVRLTLNTSFNGKDRLVTRLNARNITTFSGNFTGTNQTRLSFDGDEDNDFIVDKLYYRFAIGDNLRVQIDALNDEIYDAYITALSPLASAGAGSISRFGRFNPTLRVNNPGSVGSAGITFEYRFSDGFALQGGFLSDRDSNDPGDKNGLFDGNYSAVAQLLVRPSKAFDIGLFYAHSYYSGNDVNLTGSTGTGFATRPFGNVATATDTLGAQLQWRLSPQFVLGGWFGAWFANNVIDDNDATILNGAVFLAFPDLGQKGNLGALLVGIPPKVTDNDVSNREDDDTPFHIEALYRLKINQNIAITPGVFVLINPEGNSDNATQFVGVIRTTFTF